MARSRRKRGPAPVISLVETRKASEGQKWTPLQLLEDFIADLKAGKINPTAIAIHYTEPTPDGGLRPCIYTANMPEHMSIALSFLQMQQALERWRQP